jgi:sigma-E factor negative regulatory protein RseC
MKEQFEVIEIENQTMKLKANRSGGCNSCSASGGCGVSVLANYFEHYSTFNKPLQLGAIVGDMVVLEISSAELFWRAFQLYIIPLLALFVGSGFGSVYFPMNELWQIGFGFFGFFVALLAIKYFIK